MKEYLVDLFERVPFGPLNGILVVEIGQHVSGPLAAEELARQGALVIKLEQAKGDPSRIYLSKANFTSLNAAKLSIVVDKNEVKLYQEILALADVVIDNRAPQTKDKDNILQTFLKSYDHQHPVIFCSIVGYDSKENKHKRALDVSVQAETGMAMTNAPHPDFPLKVGFTVIDIATAFKAASHIIAHLFYLKTKGLKSSVIRLEISMAKVSAQLQSGQFLNYINDHKEHNRTGNRDIFLSPFSFYETQNGLISLAIIDEIQFKKLCQQVLKREDLLEKYSTNKIRLESLTFEKELSAILAAEPREYWIKVCEQYNIPCTKVNSIREAMQEPFATSLFTKTKDDTCILTNTYLSSLFKESPLNGAPQLNEHCVFVKALVAFQQKNGFTSFALLWQSIKNQRIITDKFPERRIPTFWQKPIHHHSNNEITHPNDSLRAKL